jgi:hypothetical protein
LNSPCLATVYHQLGRIAEQRGHLDQAETWYHKSLTIEEHLNNQPGMATSFGQLGLLEERRGQADDALSWMVRCVSLFTDFPHPSTGPGPGHLARLTAQLGMDALEEQWRQVTGQPLPLAVRDFVTQAATTQGDEPS